MLQKKEIKVDLWRSIKSPWRRAIGEPDKKAAPIDFLAVTSLAEELSNKKIRDVSPEEISAFLNALRKIFTEIGYSKKERNSGNCTITESDKLFIFAKTKKSFSEEHVDYLSIIVSSQGFSIYSGTFRFDTKGKKAGLDKSIAGAKKYDGTDSYSHTRHNYQLFKWRQVRPAMDYLEKWIRNPGCSLSLNLDQEFIRTYE